MSSFDTALLFVGLVVLFIWFRNLDLRMRGLEKKLAALGAAGAPRQRGDAQDTVSGEPETALPAEPAMADFGLTDGESARPAEDETEGTGAPAAGRPARKPGDLESAIGGRWSVLLGGVAVALGALFLVKYSIEAGLLGPRARTLGGAILSAALLAGGEWLRRRDRRQSLPTFMSADIPGVLTGAGSVAAFGTLYAAYALYGFIGPAAAFIGLTGVGIASLLLASIHGPKLAAIGMLGSYLTPILVSTGEPNPVALAMQTLIVTGAIMLTSRIRGWLWLAKFGVAGSIFWAAVTGLDGGSLAEPAAGVLIIGLAVIYVVTFAWNMSSQPEPLEDRPADRTGIAAFALLALVMIARSPFAPEEFGIAATLALSLIYVATASLWPAFTLVAILAAAITVSALGNEQIWLIVETGLFNGEAMVLGEVPPDIADYVIRLVILAAPVAAAAVYGGWRAAPTAPRMAGHLGTAAALVIALSAVAAYLRIAPFQTHYPTAIAALALAMLSIWLTEAFARARPADMKAPAPAAFATAAVGLVALAMGILMTRQWLPAGMALASAGVAWIHGRRPVSALAPLAAILSLLAASGLYFNLPFSADAIGTFPFFNRLILIVGLPAAAVIAGGEMFRRAGRSRWGAFQTALGLALLAMFVALELRHFITGGDIDAAHFSLADMAVQTMAALGFAIGLQGVARRSNISIFDICSIAAGLVSLVMIVVGLFILYNPFVAYEPVGEGRIFNLLMPAYLLPGLMAALVARLAERNRPAWYRRLYGLISGLLVLSYVTLMVRHGFQGSLLVLDRETSDAEFWTYSAVWLAMGGVLLAAGLVLKSLQLRAASAAVILLTVFKVFLIDLSALTGALRAFSFIGLGLSLLLIGRLYQQILVKTGNRPAGSEDAGTAAPDS